MTLIQSRTRGRTVVVTLPTGEEYLLLQITIDCPDCCPPGQPYEVLIAGHHLSVVKQLIDDAMAQHPTLTEASDKTVVVRHKPFAGVAPDDPTRN